MKKNNILILLLLLFGFLYSSYLFFYLGYYTSVVIALLTIGFASTIYVLDKSINRRIIFYVWIAIILVSIFILFLHWVFSMTAILMM
jgi:hypothetical protein